MAENIEIERQLGELTFEVRSKGFLTYVYMIDLGLAKFTLNLAQK